MDLSVRSSLDKKAWESATAKEQTFLAFCMAFVKVSGEVTDSESDHWDVILAAEAKIRAYLVENKFQIIKQEDFELHEIADGILAGKVIRSLQAHYGISVCGMEFANHSLPECDRKFNKAIKVAERLAMIGCSKQDNLPYFNAGKHLASL